MLGSGHKSDAYQAKLVAAGACEAVARALMKFSEVEAVAYSCCRTLVVLLANNDAYKAKLGAMGVCACIVESMHTYPSSEQVAKWGCRAVAVLVEASDANISRIGESCYAFSRGTRANPHMMTCLEHQAWRGAARPSQ